MLLLRITLLTGGIALGLSLAAAQDTHVPGKSMQTIQMPATPNPARINLDSKTTAVIVLDYVEDICGRQPNCTEQDAATHDELSGTGPQGRAYHRLRHA